jgi:hypothetical protein
MPEDQKQNQPLDPNQAQAPNQDPRRRRRPAEGGPRREPERPAPSRPRKKSWYKSPYVIATAATGSGTVLGISSIADIFPI